MDLETHCTTRRFVKHDGRCSGTQRARGEKNTQCGEKTHTMWVKKNTHREKNTQKRTLWREKTQIVGKHTHRGSNKHTHRGGKKTHMVRVKHTDTLC